MMKTNLGGRGSFSLTTLRSHSITEGSRAEAQAEAMEKCCLLTCSPWISQPDFLYNSGPLSQGWHYLQCAGPTANINQERHPTDLPLGQFYGGNFSTQSPSFQIV